jgi:D-amino-acid dehydrogenase
MYRTKYSQRMNGMKKIIIVGAGILGASAAYHLTKLGADVTVIDRKDAGQATDAAAGIVCPWVSQRRNQAWYKLAKGGAKYYPELIEELQKDGETDTGYKQVGAIILHREEDKIKKIQERTLKRKEDAPEIGSITPLSKEETKNSFPPLSEDFFSVHIEGAARVDGRALRDSLLRAAVKKGAVYIHGNAKLLFECEHVKGVYADVKSLYADEVIICAGAWANELLKPLGLTFKVTYQKAQIAHLKMEDANTSAWPVVMPPSDQYLLAFDEQRIVAGATHENNIEGFDTRVTAGGLQEVFNKALETAPGLEECTFLEARTGFRPFTPGFLPVVGFVPGWRGLAAANGLGASGLTMGPYIGRELAKLALGMELEIDLKQYEIKGALGD